ncbi:GDSL-type esterase/lipase family protein [Stieleria sp. TO1_6]|uniref:GDSL-type esterase/lipase family protein n=1 Tax=Stieleria tagensis TaxID=2956795 RepID=UPI00209AAA88|nr:GDSL-type esterase/lipase family protein [Stieleria tagensis]MCO8121845.1 GDSL-type esterase/lipase family protein [Stieleria tagensis]
MRLLMLLVFVCVSCGSSVAQDVLVADQADQGSSVSELLAPYRDAAEKRWSKDIAAFDELNAAETDSADSILFIGSSSIRRWTTMETDMAPYRTIRRGYGGAKFTDMAVFAERLITPHQYRAIVMFVGNGVVGKPDDHTPDQIEALARSIVAVSQQHQPGVPFLLIEITPCESRFAVWPKIRAVNARLREIALSTPDTYFIPTASHYLKPDGTPRPELFVQDKLHLSDAGYDLWSSLIRRRLDDVLRSMARQQANESTPDPKPQS